MLDPDLSMDEIMRRWPATTAVVVGHRLLCVGCPVGSFHTVTEACEAHGVEEHRVVEALLAAIAGRRGATSSDGSPQ